MKLLSIASSSVKGGATISLLNTLRGLKHKGIEIRVVVPQKGYLTEMLENEDIEYILCDVPYWAWPRVGGWRNYWKIPFKLMKVYLNEITSIFLLTRVLNSWRPDLIHTNVSVINLGYILSKRLNIPHVWHIREYGDKDFNIHSLYGRKRLREHLNRGYSICITKELKSYFNLGDKSQVIYNGIEEPECRIEKNSDFVRNKNKIIFVGRLTEEKGVSEIVKSFIYFLKKNKQFSLDLIGSCSKEYREYLQNIIKKHNVEKSIKIVGAVNNPYVIMQQAGALIVASKSEGFGRITAEAMLNGCLVIGKNTAGTKEQFDNGVEIFGKEIGIRYGDEKSLETALQEFANLTEKQYNEMTKDAQLTVTRLYSVKQNVEQTNKYFHEIISTTI